MTVSAKNLIEAKYASSSANTEYTAPALTKTIIDKFTITNTDASSQTVTVNLVPSGGTAGNSNAILLTQAINSNACYDSQELKNQILATGDFISVTASVASKLTIRASGREVT